MLSDRPLFERLNAFSLDDESVGFKFSDRLALENGWRLGFAKDAVREYRRFVYLAAIASTAVTPSDVVDQVWHLHLTYTRSYWDEMCGVILRKPLHHDPTKGGAQEVARYSKLYEATLAAYAREFDVAPPRAFWPVPDDRFAARQRWVDLRTSLVVPYRSIVRGAAALTGIGALGFGSAAFAAGKTSAPLSVLPIALIAGAVLALIGLAASGTGKRRRRDDGGSDGGGGTWSPGGSSHHGGHGHGHGGGHDGGGHAGCSGGSGCSGGGCSSS